MSALLFGVLLGAIVALVLSAPLLASWPTRLRCVLVAQTMDPFGGMPGWSTLVMCEVAIVAVSMHGDTVEVTVAEVCGASTRLRRLVVRSTAPGLVAQLEGWSAVRLPLILASGESGDMQLVGPGTTLVGFQEASRQEHRHDNG